MNALDMSALMGGGPPPDMGGGTPVPAVGPGGGSPEDEPISILQQMLQLAQQYQGVEPDEQDKAVVAQLMAGIQKLLAKDQADRDKMLGNPTLARALR